MAWEVWPVFVYSLSRGTGGENQEDDDMASLHLWGMEQDGEDIPAPTSMQDVHLEDGETLCLLDVNMFKIRAKMDNHSVKKTLTIPWYLNTLAEERKINFSQLLQGALRQRLGLD